MPTPKKRKAHLGDYIYIIGPDFVCREQIGYIGVYSFIIEGFRNSNEEWIEFFLDDCGKTWEYTLLDAKTHFTKLHKISDDYWESDINK